METISAAHIRIKITDEVENISAQRDTVLRLRTRNDVHQLGYLLSLINFISRSERVLDTIRHMIPKDLFLDTPQSSADRHNLGYDIDAISVLLNHAGNTADLTFDPAQSFRARGFDFLAHTSLYPYRVYFQVGSQPPRSEHHGQSRSSSNTSCTGIRVKAFFV